MNEREIERTAQQVFMAFGRLIKGYSRQIWFGMKKLKNRTYLIILLASLPIAAGFVIFRHRLFFSLSVNAILQWAMYILAVILPLHCLWFFGFYGGAKSRQYKQAFEQIVFCGKDGNIPYMTRLSVEDQGEIASFRSLIPLETWHRLQPELETTLDCTIVEIQQGRSRQEVELIMAKTMNLPKSTAWDNKNLKKDRIILGDSETGVFTILIEELRHILVAGETGSGKSVLLRLMAWQAICNGVTVIPIDFKGGLEFGNAFRRFCPVVTKHEEALALFEMLIQEDESRKELFFRENVKDLKSYNKKTGNNLSRIIVITDEYAEMMDITGLLREEKELIEKLRGRLQSLARVGRSVGLHLILGSQRIDSTVISGQIKTNATLRISGPLGDRHASEIVVGNKAAFLLPNVKGRFVVKDGRRFTTIQVPYFDDYMMQDPPEPAVNVLYAPLKSWMQKEEIKNVPESEIPPVQPEAVEADSNKTINYASDPPPPPIGEEQTKPQPQRIRTTKYEF